MSITVSILAIVLSALAIIAFAGVAIIEVRQDGELEDPQSLAILLIAFVAVMALSIFALQQGIEERNNADQGSSHQVVNERPSDQEATQ